MLTTLAGISTNEKGQTIFNVGDTRVYGIGNSSVELLSKDHTVGAEKRSFSD